ncbi:MAG TPA: DUF433 domain-containing protein [Anaerolineae bacterium]|nr:DUF433 domain-containing protein [Anaerolineae bacterium]
MCAIAKAPVQVATDETVWFDDLGHPMIPGTRIPIYYLIHYLAYAEDGLDGFYQGYPHVTPEQVEKALDWLLHHLGWRDPEEVMNMPLEWS